MNNNIDNANANNNNNNNNSNSNKMKFAQLVRKKCTNLKNKGFFLCNLQNSKSIYFSLRGEYGQMLTTWKTVCHNFTVLHTLFYHYLRLNNSDKL